MAKIIDGKALASRRRDLLAKRVLSLTEDNGRPPSLSVILVGNYPPSVVYVNAKRKACLDVGIGFNLIALPEDSFEEKLAATIANLNRDPNVDGVLLQLPLPKNQDPFKYLAAIDYKKDVDGLSPYSLGCLLAKKPVHVPCTPKGIMEILRSVGFDLTGKRAVVLGRSLLVGRPLALLLEQANATVTMVHSRTPNPETICGQADVLISAIGKPGHVTSAFVKPGAIVIDVGITDVNGSLKGDVDFASVEKVAGYLTPVPGGVGPMTVSQLLENVVNAACLAKVSAGVRG